MPFVENGPAPRIVEGWFLWDQPLASVRPEWVDGYKHMNMGNYLVAYDLLSISSRFWDGLTQPQRDAIQAAVNKAIDQSTQRHLAQEQEMVAFFRSQGLEVYEPDVAAFRAEAQRRYLASPQSQGWPAGILDRIAAVR